MNKFNLYIIFSLFVFVTCEPYPPGPELQTEILDVIIVPNEAFPLDKVYIKVRYTDSLNTGFNFTWYFDGEEKFTTDTNVIYKKVPSEPGDYPGIIEINNGNDNLIPPNLKFLIKVKEND